MSRPSLAVQSVPDDEIDAAYAAEWDPSDEPFPGRPPTGRPLAAVPAGRDRRPVPRLAEVAERVRPVVRADEQALPVLPPLAGLLPDGGLPRGVEVAVSGGAGGGALSLALALLAGPARAGSWVAAVGVPRLGLVAAAELGLPLDHLAVVAAPGPEAWGPVVGALVGSFDLILVAPDHPRVVADTRRLATRRRERGTVLVHVPPGRGGGRAPRPDADLCLRITRSAWEGLGEGHGRLGARRVRVETDGRGRTARRRQADLWLPGPDGAVVAIEPRRAEGRARLVS